MAGKFEPTSYKGVKIKNGNYYINYRDENGVSRRKMVAEAKTAKEAFRLLTEAKGRVADIKSGKLKVMSANVGACKTLDELAERFYSERDTKDNKHEAGRYKLRVSPYIGSKPLPLTFNDAEWFQGQLKNVVSEATGKVLSPKSINNITDSVRAMFNWGKKRGYVEGENVFTQLTRLSVDNERKRILSTEEFEMVLNECDSYYKLIAMMAFYTGARPVSYLNLTIDDIEVVSRDPESDDYMRPKLIHFSSVKKGASYAVPVAKKLESALWARLLDMADKREIMQGHKWVFPRKTNPKLVASQTVVRKYFQKIFDKLFNEGVTDDKYRVILYTLRHSAASHIVANTGNVHIAMKLLNHTSIKTTMKYVKTNDEQLQSAVDLF